MFETARARLYDPIQATEAIGAALCLRSGTPSPTESGLPDMVDLILTGDVNLMTVTDAQVPFRRVKDILLSADLVFANLECCLSSRVNEASTHVEGFFADPHISAVALTQNGIAAVGLANNVNYG